MPYHYPTAQELKEIERNLLPTLTMDDPIFDLFPIVESNKTRLKWRQRDNFQGLQNVRGLGGEFKVVNAVGVQEYDFEPGYYGEMAVIDEAELTEAAELSSFTDFIPITDAVAERQSQLLNREIDRMRKIMWDLVSTGTFTVPDRAGSVKYLGTFPLQTQSAAVPWATSATAKPFSDLLDVPLKARGYSHSFGAGSKAYMNQNTFKYLLTNANTSDLFGRRNEYGATFNSLSGINELIKNTKEAQDLTELVCYDKGYYSDGIGDGGRTAGTWYPFIPDNKVIIVGRRTNGAPIGEYRLTRNINNEGSAAGFYNFVRDMTAVKAPKQIQVERGHNGGPVVWFPGAVLILTVS